MKPKEKRDTGKVRGETQCKGTCQEKVRTTWGGRAPSCPDPYAIPPGARVPHLPSGLPHCNARPVLTLFFVCYLSRFLECYLFITFFQIPFVYLYVGVGIFLHLSQRSSEAPNHQLQLGVWPARLQNLQSGPPARVSTALLLFEGFVVC